MQNVSQQLYLAIGIARGCSGCTCSPRAEEKNIFRRNLQGKFVSAPPAHQVHPQAEQESILWLFFLCGEDLELQLVVLDRLLMATTKKIVNFLEEKSAPPDKILATPIWTWLALPCRCLSAYFYSYHACVRLLSPLKSLNHALWTAVVTVQSALGTTSINRSIFVVGGLGELTLAVPAPAAERCCLTFIAYLAEWRWWMTLIGWRTPSPADRIPVYETKRGATAQLTKKLNRRRWLTWKRKKTNHCYL